MAVALDANATSDVGSAASVSSIDLTTLTVGSGSNRALVVQLNFGVQAVSGVSVTWDNGGTNQACSLIKSANTTAGSGRAELWGLVAPTSGNKTLHVAWTTASDVLVNATAFTGVDQTGGATTFPNSVSATSSVSTTVSNTVTSASGDAVIDTVVDASAGNLVSTNQTQLYLDNANASIIDGGGSWAAGAATVTFTWTIDTTLGFMVDVATSIKAASGGGSINVTLVAAAASAAVAAFGIEADIGFGGVSGSASVAGLGSTLNFALGAASSTAAAAAFAITISSNITLVAVTATAAAAAIGVEADIGFGGVAGSASVVGFLSSLNAAMGVASSTAAAGIFTVTETGLLNVALASVAAIAAATAFAMISTGLMALFRTRRGAPGHPHRGGGGG